MIEEEKSMRQVLTTFIAMMTAIVLVLTAGAASAQDADVRVIVPDVPGGVIVSNCYRAVGRIYGGYTFDFCLKRRGTYTVTGRNIRCEGRLDWDVRGATVDVKLRRTSCGRGVAWSADTMSCKPNLVLGLIAGLLGQKRPLLDNLVCDYRPARGSGESPINFVARRR